MVLRALLYLRRVLLGHDIFSRMVNVWIDDYCVWVQSLPAASAVKYFGELCDRVEKNRPGMDQLGWRLQEALDSIQFEDE